MCNSKTNLTKEEISSIENRYEGTLNGKVILVLACAGESDSVLSIVAIGLVS